MVYMCVVLFDVWYDLFGLYFTDILMTMFVLTGVLLPVEACLSILRCPVTSLLERRVRREPST